jgi:hypothetical protein
MCGAGIFIWHENIRQAKNWLARERETTKRFEELP